MWQMPKEFPPNYSFVVPLRAVPAFRNSYFVTHHDLLVLWGCGNNLRKPNTRQNQKDKRKTERLEN